MYNTLTYRLPHKHESGQRYSSSHSMSVIRKAITSGLIAIIAAAPLHGQDLKINETEPTKTGASQNPRTDLDLEEFLDRYQDSLDATAANSAGRENMSTYPLPANNNVPQAQNSNVTKKPNKLVRFLRGYGIPIGIGVGAGMVIDAYIDHRRNNVIQISVGEPIILNPRTGEPIKLK